MNFMTIMTGSEDNVACAANGLYFVAVKENRRVIYNCSGFRPYISKNYNACIKS